MKSKKIAGFVEGDANCERGRPGKIVPTTWIAKMSQPLKDNYMQDKLQTAQNQSLTWEAPQCKLGGTSV